MKRDFDIDLRYGQIAEKKLEKILRGKIECKYDKIAKKSGNMFIEAKSRGELSFSGLWNTSADWFAYIIAESGLIFLFRVEILKDTIGKLYFQEKAPIILGGDRGTSRGYLVKISDVIEEIIKS